MAQNAPAAIDIQDIQFKLHRKTSVFNVHSDLKNLINLVAVAPNKGLLFVGNPYEPEFKILKLSEIDVGDYEITTRIVALISPPLSLACNCDGSMLAASYVYNNTGFLQIFHVDSFLKPEVNALYTLPVASEYTVFTTKLLWNPVIANSLAIILSDGSVGMFTLNASGQYEKHSLGKEHQVKCGCWSPKGKQIVLGLGTGNLQQFKPNLAPARVIKFPNGLHQQPFDIIEVHWLSTFQFAVILLIKGVELLPCLYIVNAPKAGGPKLINYYDICYSGPGPRQHQFIFTHIPIWNLLLVASANGVEVGILGTKESTGENPMWLQYTLLDEARIEMPLTAAKDETYPMGFALDTSCSHQLTLGENQLPVQPIIHVLSTNGQLISFNFLNLSNGAKNICSPPPPLADNSGQFIPLRMTVNDAINTSDQTEGNAVNTAIVNTNINQFAAATKDVTFTMPANNITTSTPMPNENSSLLFLGNDNKNNNSNDELIKPFGTLTSTVAAPTTFLNQFGNNTATATTPSMNIFSQTVNNESNTKNIFGEMSMQNNNSINNSNINMANSVTASITVSNSFQNHSNDINKPLYTVPATYVPPTPTSIFNQQDQQQQEQQEQQQEEEEEEQVGIEEITFSEVTLEDLNKFYEFVKRVIKLYIDDFDSELRSLENESLINFSQLGNIDDVKCVGKQLNDLHEIIDQANYNEFKTNLRMLREDMNEAALMITECRVDINLHKKSNYPRLTWSPQNDYITQRQLTRLRHYLATNENNLKQLQQSLDAQWHDFQDVMRRNSKQSVHIPYLDGVYQKMSKVKDLIMQQRQKLDLIKNRMKETGILYEPPPSSELISQQNATNVLIRNESVCIQSLTDSMVSMNLGQHVAKNRALLTPEKLQALRNLTKQQKQVNIIRPKRPDRVGLKSNVILEMKLKMEREEKEQKDLEMASKSITTIQPSQKQHQEQKQQQQQQQQQEQQQQQHMNVKSQTSVPTAVKANVAKPHASKPPPNAMMVNIFSAPSAASSALNNLNISSSSSFVKTSSAINETTINTTSTRPLATSTPFVPYAAPGLSFNFTQQTNPQQQQPQQPQQIKPTDKDITQVPVSFNAKIVQSNNEPTKPKSNVNANQLSVNKIEKGQQISDKQGPNLNKLNMNAALGTASGAATAAAPAAVSALSTSPSSGTFNFSGLGSSIGATFLTTSTESSQTKTISKSDSVTSSMPLFTGFNSPAKAAASNFTTAPALSTISATFSKTLDTKGEIPTSTTTTMATTTTTTFSNQENANIFSSTSSGNAAIVTSKPQTATNFMTSFSKPNVEPFKAGTTATTTFQQSTKPVDLTPSNNLDQEAVLSSLNICKPSSKESENEASTKPIKSITTTTAAPFSFLGAANTLENGSKNIFGQVASKGIAASGSSVFSFSSALTQNIPSGTSITPVSKTAAVATSSPPTTKTTAAEATTLGITPTTTATSSSLFGVTSTTAPVAPLFGALNLSTSTGAAAKTTGTTATTTQSTIGNIFGGSSNIFNKTSPTAPTTSSGGFSFGQGTNIFGGVSSTTPAVSSAALPTSTTAAGSGNIFGGIPKPDQSIFSGVANTPSSNAAVTPSGLFAAAAASTKPLGNTAGTNIFGGSGNLAFNSPPSSVGGSIFGGSTATTGAAGPFVSAAGGSLFGGTMATQTKSPTNAGNIFSSTGAQAAAGGSIFGKSTFGQASSNASNTNMFSSQSQTTALGNPFSGNSGGSIFASGGSANVSGGSLFGSSTSSPAFGSTAPTGTQTFGPFSSQPAAGTSAFGSPSSFAQGGASVQQSGFGSPTQTSAFTKPVFGGPATFGSGASAFGAQPTFGGAPTFGTPKAFGSFAAPAAASTSPPGTNAIGGGITFGSATQTKTNIFETLGSSDTGLSFGNLAQNTQQPVQPKPTFGGSSFMNYRS